MGFDSGCSISCIGIIIISSATNSTSAEAKDYYYVKMQLMWFAVGLATMLVAKHRLQSYWQICKYYLCHKYNFSISGFCREIC